jgi:ABC-type uncharacterized transport system fused permease/ATPase subunit
MLDEATSALDVATEKLLYSILVERGVAVIRFLADNSPINPVISST